MIATVATFTNPVFSIPEPCCQLAGASSDLRQPSGEVAGASRHPRQLSGEVTEACRNLRQPNPQVGIVPTCARRCVSHFGCELPGTLWHNPEEGIASGKVRNPSFPSGRAILRIFIHFSYLGNALGQPKATYRPLPSAPPNLPGTHSTVRLPPHGRAARRAASAHPIAQGRAQHGPPGMVTRRTPLGFCRLPFALPHHLRP